MESVNSINLEKALMDIMNRMPNEKSRVLKMYTGTTGMKLYQESIKNHTHKVNVTHLEIKLKQLLAQNIITSSRKDTLWKMLNSTDLETFKMANLIIEKL